MVSRQRSLAAPIILNTLDARETSTGRPRPAAEGTAWETSSSMRWEVREPSPVGSATRCEG